MFACGAYTKRTLMIRLGVSFMTQSVDQIVVRKEQLTQLLSFNIKNTVTNSFFAAFLAYVQLDALPLWIVLSWFVSIVFVNIIRFAIGRYYCNQSIQTPTTVNRRLNIFRAGLILSTMLWGGNILLVMNTTIEQALFVGYLLAGMAAGAALVYSIDFICAIAFAVFSLVPVIIFYLLSGEQFLVLVGTSGTFYVLFLIVSIKTINRSLIAAVLLREEAVKSAEEVKKLAFYDLLTMLPNRRLLLERLERAVAHSWRTGTRGAIVFIDLDHFKKLNDTLGHDMGDALLVQVAERLKDSVRESDTASRFGGDEFVLLLENLNENAQVALQEVDQITQKMIASLNAPYHLTGVDYLSTPSIGVALFGEHGRTQQALLKHADIAMYHAKRTGRNRVSIYDESMQKAADEDVG